MFVAPPSPPVDHSFFDFSALFASHDFFLQPGPQHTGTDTALDSPDERRAQTTRSVLGSFSELLPLRGVLDRARSQTPTIKMKIVETIAIPIIQEFFSSVEPSEKETLDVHFKALEACLPTLDEALHNAKLDDPALARSLSTIVLDALPQGSKELAYSQFLIDIRRLLNRLKERPGIVLSLVLPILRSVLAQNSSEDRMTPLQGWELIGELRFLLDRREE